MRNNVLSSLYSNSLATFTPAIIIQGKQASNVSLPQTDNTFAFAFGF